MPATRSDRAARTALFSVLPYPRRLRLAPVPLRAFPAGQRRPDAGRGGRPGTPHRQAARALPPRIAARPTGRAGGAAVVGLLTGCAQSVFFRHVSAATARVLAMEGCDVVVPPGQGCCGALSLHAGRRAAGAPAGPAGGRGVHPRRGGHCRHRRRRLRFGHEGVRPAARRRSEVGDRAAAAGRQGPRRDRVPRRLEPVADRHPLPMTVAYHDACHLAHGQGITPAAPRRCCAGIPTLRVVDLGRRWPVLRIGRHVQPDAAGDRGRAGRAQGRRDHGDRRDRGRRRQPGLPAADRGVAAAGRVRRSRPGTRSRSLDASLRGRGVPVSAASGQARREGRRGSRLPPEITATVRPVGQLVAGEQVRRRRHRATRLGDEIRLPREQADRRRRSRPRSPSRCRPAAPEVRERQLGRWRTHAVGDRPVGLLDRPRDAVRRCARLSWRLGRELRLDADHRDVGASALIAVATPEASPPPPTGTRTTVDVRQVLDDLQADRALAGDDVPVVERRDTLTCPALGDLGHDRVAGRPARRARSRRRAPRRPRSSPAA